MITWPDDLVEDIASRRCVLFLGAGVSKNATNTHGEHPKDWREYLEYLANNIEDPLQADEVRTCITDSDLLTACELAKRFLRPDVFKRRLLSEYSDKGFESAPIHDDLVLVDSRYVLTTNFDKLYENRANTIQRNTVRVKNYYDTDVADVFRRSQRAVLKVHGTIDSPDRTIFTRSDYARARTNHAHFYRLLDALFISHTFVFLGASLRDPDIQMLLEDHAYRFERTRPHFMVMPTGTTRQAVVSIMEESMNLRALSYDSANNHAELAASVKELVQLVTSERQRLTQTLDW
jgi:hypothetical protein